MENSSPSPISPESPTTYAPDAFRPSITVLAFLGMLALIAIVLIVAVVGFVVANHGDFTAITHQTVPFALAVQGLIDVIAAVYLLIVLPGLAHTTLRGLGFRMPRASDVGIAILGAIAMIVVVNGLGNVIDSLLHAKHQQEAVKIFLGVHDPVVKAAFALLAIVVAPISEEIAFRVFVFSAVRRYAPFWLAAIVSGILFGLAHTDVYALVPLIFGGVILCGVYARTRNAWMSMISHGLFNGASVVALYLAPQLTK